MPAAEGPRGFSTAASGEVSVVAPAGPKPAAQIRAARPQAGVGVAGGNHRVRSQAAAAVDAL